MHDSHQKHKLQTLTKHTKPQRHNKPKHTHTYYNKPQIKQKPIFTKTHNSTIVKI